MNSTRTVSAQLNTIISGLDLGQPLQMIAKDLWDIKQNISDDEFVSFALGHLIQQLYSSSPGKDTRKVVTAKLKLLSDKPSTNTKSFFKALEKNIEQLAQEENLIISDIGTLARYLFKNLNKYMDPNEKSFNLMNLINNEQLHEDIVQQGLLIPKSLVNSAADLKYYLDAVIQHSIKGTYLAINKVLDRGKAGLDLLLGVLESSPSDKVVKAICDKLEELPLAK